MGRAVAGAMDCSRSHRCGVVQHPLPQHENDSLGSCPSWPQVLSVHDCDTDNGLPCGVVLKKGFCDYLTAHRHGTALRASEIYQISVAQLSGTGSCRPFCLISVEIISVIRLHKASPVLGVKVVRVCHHCKMGPHTIPFPLCPTSPLGIALSFCSHVDT